jgi:histidinol-phosphate aminotransferase
MSTQLTPLEHASVVGSALFRELLKKGVIVRPMGARGLPPWIRVTIGPAEDNRKFLSASMSIASPQPYVLLV